MRDRPKVGEILVQAGVIDELQLAAALGEQTRWGRRLGMTLIKLGMVQEGHLVRALAKQFDLPVASLAGKKIAPEVIALVPAKVACEHSVVPLFVKKEGRKELLFLGMEEPSDLGVLDDLAFRTGMMIRPVMVGPTEIGEALDRYYTAKSAAAVPAAAATPTFPDFDRSADTLSETNLRRIREEAAPSLSQLLTPAPVPIPAPETNTPVAATRIAVEPIEEITARVAVVAAPVAPVSAPIPEPVSAPVEMPAAPAAAVTPVVESVSVPTPMSRTTTPPPAAANDDLALERVHLLEETERTRLVAKAMAHLLIEKGILTLDELQARIEKLKTKPPGSAV